MKNDLLNNHLNKIRNIETQSTYLTLNFNDLNLNNIGINLNDFFLEDLTKINSLIFYLTFTNIKSKEYFELLNLNHFKKINEILKNPPKKTESEEIKKELPEIIRNLYSFLILILKFFPNLVPLIDQTNISQSLFELLPFFNLSIFLKLLFSYDINYIIKLSTIENFQFLYELLKRFNNLFDEQIIILDTLSYFFLSNTVLLEFSYDFIELLNLKLNRILPDNIICSIFQIFSSCNNDLYIELLFNFKIIDSIFNNFTLFHYSIYNFIFKIFEKILKSNFNLKLLNYNFLYKIYAWIYGSIIDDLNDKRFEIIFICSNKYIVIS